MKNVYERINELLGTDYKSDTDIDWFDISMNKSLSEDFIREFCTKVDWYVISEYQILSEGLIGEFQYNVNWYAISTFQKLSEGFIGEFKDKVIWGFTARVLQEFTKLLDNYI